ncbi:branched-chain amino acid transporter [Virgibacillus dokdonensis]|uniref:Branched-chain amino acid transporter n=2 Tax=Virgibacillus TaxID=84406 RepID=A0A3E0WT87_9BACI|nr:MULTISPECIES: AzlD domain-containing protein [Virgibacillus]RFA35205.1 branched-chain amino acid transporter [Virgibacillus dokdonensis]
MMLFIVAGMALVTMIPRVIPAFIVDKLQFRDWVNRWLNAIPYAALGALIFPGIMSVKADEPHIGLFGGIVAILLAYLGVHIILVVITAIVTVYLLT